MRQGRRSILDRLYSVKNDFVGFNISGGAFGQINPLLIPELGQASLNHLEDDEQSWPILWEQPGGEGTVFCEEELVHAEPFIDPITHH